MQNLSGIKDPVFRDAMALAKPAGRLEQQRFLVEDSSMVHQALRDCPDRVRAVFCKSGESAPFESACAASKIPIYLATSGLVAKLIGTGYETATSAAAVVEMPNHSPGATPNPSGILLAGESIQDPRNVGVLVRTADALGCDALVLSRDSADPWQRAAVRSTTGSILRLPVILVDNFPVHLRQLAESGAQVVGSSGNVERDVFQIDWSPRPLVVVVGNEQAGMTRDAMDACTAVARLPMTSATRADSLNVTVAAGMLLLEALRAGR